MSDLDRRHLVAVGLALLVAGCAPRGRRIEGATAGSGIEPVVDEVVVVKSQRRLYLRSRGRDIKSYQVAIGSNPWGHKQEEGDRRTPEGVYRIFPARPSLNGFNLFLPISYPNDSDIQAATELGIGLERLGGDIGLHGTGSGPGALLHSVSDRWTAGCIAVTDREIEEIARLIKEPIPIRIVP